MKKNDLILWFEDIRKKNIALVGGKAANLGELFFKLTIPNGFCVTVKAFESFLQKADIKDKIMLLLRKVNIDKPEEIDSISNQIKKLVINSKISKELQSLILQSYKKLNGFVAVRSSAVAEDLEEASFAGQQATFLNVQGKNNLIESVKKCWASFYAARAIIYREKNRFSHEPIMAVIIQKMVDSKKSGVIFTVNPVNKNKNEIIIEAVFGLGEAIVSGIVTPDHYVIDKKRNHLLKEIINEKRTAMFRVNGKNKKQALSNKKANEKTLNSKELNQLVKEALRIEKYYKKPMDIEWAIDDKVYILQARPITTL